MEFTSINFYFFLAITVLAYSITPSNKRLYILSSASLVFIGSWGMLALFLFLLTVMVDFYVARYIKSNSDKKSSRWLLCLCVSSHLILWLYFKLQLLHSSESILLPLGLSFYSFQSVGYVLSVYWGRIESEKSLHNYIAFNAFFPQLAAGPIERAERIIPQFKKLGSINYDGVSWGLYLIALGLFKKVLFVDRLTPIYKGLTDGTAEYVGIEIAVLAYLGFFLFYFDLSSYTNIARGIGKIFNIDISINFNKPYLAKDLADFWRRWHITITSWMEDYIYMPILFKTRNAYLSLFCLYLVFGFWHATSWNYMALGLFLVLVQLFYSLLDSKVPIWRKKVSMTIQRIIFFHVLCLGGILLMKASYLDILNGYKDVLIMNTPLLGTKVFSHDMIIVYFVLAIALVLENIPRLQSRKMTYVLMSFVLIFLTIVFRTEKSYLFIYLGM